MPTQINKPLVSISCITFNQVNYIRETIDSFLMQKTSFPIEILIHDDASNDGTTEIVKEYEEKYPGIILPLYETENQWNKGRRGSAIFNYPRARGKYIALCEGDDYWTDPYKLQKQVDFLENNPKCSINFHAAKHSNESEPWKSYIYQKKNSKFTIRDVILGGGGFMTTNSMVFKTEFVKELPEWFYKSPVGDYPLMLILASKGEIGYLHDNMSVYRLMASGSWTLVLNSSKLNVENHYKSILRMLNDFNKWTKYKYSNYVFQKKSENFILHKYYIYSTKCRLFLSNLHKLRLKYIGGKSSILF